MMIYLDIYGTSDTNPYLYNTQPYNIKPKWDIVAVNGFRDWSSMLGILQSLLGPTNVVQIPNNNLLEQSLNNNSGVHNNNNNNNIHPLPPPSQQQKVHAMRIIPFDRMSLNSSAIAKEVLNEYDDDDTNIQIKCDINIFKNCQKKQQIECKKLEETIKQFQNKNAQLLEALQVIRLKGEMEKLYKLKIIN